MAGHILDHFVFTQALGYRIESIVVGESFSLTCNLKARFLKTFHSPHTSALSHVGCLAVSAQRSVGSFFFSRPSAFLSVNPPASTRFSFFIYISLPGAIS